MIYKIDKGLCWLCEITNWKNNKSKEQMIVIHNDGKKYCKFHYGILKEYETQTRGLTKEEVLESLIKEGKRIGIKNGLTY